MKTSQVLLLIVAVLALIGIAGAGHRVIVGRRPIAASLALLVCMLLGIMSGAAACSGS